MKRLALVVLLAACGGAKQSSTSGPGGGGGSAAAATKVLVNVDAEGVGLGGFDPLAYHTTGKPASGLPEHTAEHGGAKYRFSSSANAGSFDGGKHAPAYGGYCAFAAAQGGLAPANPMVFEIHEGQLLVFANADFRDQFDQDRAGNKAKADANWPRLLAEHGR